MTKKTTETSKPKSDRPKYLIMVTQSGGGLDIWSSHHEREDAETMKDRLEDLCGLTGNRPFLIEVPVSEGIQKAQQPKRKIQQSPPGTVVPIIQKDAQPILPQSAEEFQEETKKIMQQAEDGIARDVDDPISEGGAVSG